jgi:molecular chaperone GrpE
MDDFDRARTALGAQKKGLDTKGILIIMDRLADALRREGLSEVEASPGSEFDPEVHEAVLTIPTAEIPSGRVAQLLEKGYLLGDRLLRPAKVGVARAPEPSAPDT